MHHLYYHHDCTFDDCESQGPAGTNLPSVVEIANQSGGTNPPWENIDGGFDN
jgi:hypothetical protein